MSDLEQGPYKVLLKRGEFVDESRQNDDGSVRAVPYKIYHPAEDESAGQKFPLIIWSHGFGGSRDGASFISRYVAAHGYIICHLTHHGTDSSLWEGKGGHPWDILQKVHITRETTLNRFADVPFALDSLAGHELVDMMDFDRIGMSGHSFGAMTTQVMAGQLFPDAEGNLMNLREPRFKAGIAYSPTTITHLSDAAPEELYGPIGIPLLHMTGTEDASPMENYGYERRLLIHEHTGHPEKYLHVLEGGDHMIYNGTRGKLGNNELREQHEAEILETVLNFWNAQMKGAG